jgi:hypothetical protein
MIIKDVIVRYYPYLMDCVKILNIEVDFNGESRITYLYDDLYNSNIYINIERHPSNSSFIFEADINEYICEKDGHYYFATFYLNDETKKHIHRYTKLSIINDI